MKYFSDRELIRIGNNMGVSSELKHNIEFLRYKAPSWLRVQYIRDVFNYFAQRKNDYFYYFDSNPPNDLLDFPLQKISDEICIQLKHDSLTNSESNYYLFITDLIRNCNWHHFYDIIEIIAHVLSSLDFEIINVWEGLTYRYEDDPDDAEMYFNFREARVRLDEYGIDTYLYKVNQLFNSTELPFRIGPDGQLILEPKSNANNKSTLHETNSIDKQNEIIETRGYLEEFLALVKKSKILDDEDRSSIKNSTTLFQEKQFQNSLEILFPNIEKVMNRLITNNGGDDSKFHGLANKVEWLGKNNILSKDITRNVDFLRMYRNKIAHGDLSMRPGFAEPACVFAIRWYKLLR